ncbi:hypothetical protein PV08_06169 [Exophiala spinifera]|uniref:DUF7908 domain-containing protein n=1 Tax=Exophiala spinifera TaxID=91928 RepID=A0A0D2BAW5_9EURO|nr:uncharacterized protein PV08_06169 [Exophiala spinifera]KIW16118.1 hypothetical protein PV08_06169 [Exophiala spinifera]
MVTDVTEAAQFYLQRGQLITKQGQFVHLDVANGYAIFKSEKTPQDKGVSWRVDGQYLEVFGPRFNACGRRKGCTCLSQDENIFVEASRHPPFPCRQFVMRPNPGTRSLPSPTRPTPAQPVSTAPSTAVSPISTQNTTPPPTTRTFPSTTGEPTPNPSYDPDPELLPRTVGSYVDDMDEI